MHSMYADRCNVAHDVIPIMLHTFRVVGSSFRGQDVIGCRQSQTAGKTLCKNVVVWQYAETNNGLLQRDDPVLDTKILIKTWK
jgi:hypothetical protein